MCGHGLLSRNVLVTRDSTPLPEKTAVCSVPQTDTEDQHLPCTRRNPCVIRTLTPQLRFEVWGTRLLSESAMSCRFFIPSVGPTPIRN